MGTTMFRIAVAFLVIAGMSANSWGQDLTKLLQRIPGNANVLTVIDAKALMNSQRAATDGWSAKRSLEYQSGQLPFPPGLNFCVIASEYLPIEQRNAWQVSLLEFPGKVYEDKVAKSEGSDVELVENLYVIPSRRNMYLVQFERESWGIFAPANRQKMTQWIKFAKSNTANAVNQYLTNAVIDGGSNGQVNIALDLSDTLDRAEILNRLQQSKVLDKNIDRVKWTNFIKGIRGMRLTLNVTNSFLTELRLDFNEDVAPYAAQLPGFVIETVERAGYHVGDLSQWQPKAMGKSLVMKGALDSDDFKKILSLVLPAMMRPDQDDTLTGPAATAALTQRYFKAVNNLLKDLRTKSDQMDRNRAWTVNASWYEYTVRKIDQLPIVNVDQGLVDYTNNVTAQLRICAQSLRGVNIDNLVTDSEKRKSVGYGYAGTGGYGVGGFYGGQYDNYQDVATAKAQTAAAGAKSRNAIWTQIGDATSALRSALAQKYNLEF